MLSLTELDDVNWADLVSEARALIPSLNPDWTDHNPSDPGIVLVELFAWLTEMVIYRLNVLPDENYWTFLKLLSGSDVDRTEGLESAIRAAVLDLRKPYRAVTPLDYERLAMEEWASSTEASTLGWRKEICRVRCLPECDLDATLLEVTQRHDAHQNTSPPQSPEEGLEPEAPTDEGQEPTDPTPTGPESDSPLAHVVEPHRAPGHISLVVMPRRQVLHFNGQTDYLACAVDPHTRLSGDLTVSAWICPENVAKGYQPLVTRGGEFSIVLQDSGHISILQGEADPGTTCPGLVVHRGKWSHIAITRSIALKKFIFYLNGKAVGTAEYLQEPVQDRGSVWVAGTPESTCNFEGILIDVSVWRRVRTPDEIKGELSSPPPIGSRNLVAWIADRSSPGWTNRTGIRLDDPSLSGPDWTWRCHEHLVEGLRQFYDLRRLVTTRIHVVSPLYVDVFVEATLYIKLDADLYSVIQRSDAAVRSLFDLVKGGREGNGWPFGRNLYLSDVYAALEGVEGIDFVREGRLTSPQRDRALIDRAPVDHTRAPESMDPETPAVPFGLRLTAYELPVLRSVKLKLMEPRRSEWREVIL